MNLCDKIGIKKAWDEGEKIEEHVWSDFSISDMAEAHDAAMVCK